MIPLVIVPEFVILPASLEPLAIETFLIVPELLKAFKIPLFSSLTSSWISPSLLIPASVELLTEMFFAMIAPAALEIVPTFASFVIVISLEIVPPVLLMA